MDPKITNVPRREFLKTAGVGASSLALLRFNFGSLDQRTTLLLYVGTYTTNRKSEGIYLFRFDPASGKLTPAGTTSHVVDPSYLTVAPNGRYLYAVNEVEQFRGDNTGAISAFSVNANSGELKLLNQQSSLGGDPCYVSMDKAGRFLLVANYAGGNVSVLPVRSDGSLGEAIDTHQDRGSSINKERQEGPHAHSIVLNPANRFAYACDLGTDRIMIFRFDSHSGKLSAAEQPWTELTPGSGPRHITFHANGKYAYVINELNATITTFAQNASEGSLKRLQTSPTLPKSFEGENTSADIHISPDGNFLYCSNRGHDAIAGFRIRPDGQLSFVSEQATTGKTPRNFALDPTGNFLIVANQNSDQIITFRRDLKTGVLSRTDHVVFVPSPVCLKFSA